jgi:hypothetical protein
MNDNVIQLISSILNKSIDLNELSREELHAASQIMLALKKSMMGSMPDGGFTMKQELEDAGVVKVEIIKFDKCGQWKIDKADDDDKSDKVNVINYKEMNRPKTSENPTTIDYSSGKPKISGYQWKLSDSPKVFPTPPKATAKENRIKQAVREGKVIDDREKKKPT